MYLCLNAVYNLAFGDYTSHKSYILSNKTPVARHRKLAFKLLDRDVEEETLGENMLLYRSH